MSKKEFLNQLRKGLFGLPKDDIEEHINFYSEMIDDRIEDGLSEEEAINQIGTVNEIIEQILSETSITKLVKEKVKPKRALKGWEILLIILGSPIWFSLGIATLSVVFTGYIFIWSLIISICAVTFAFGVSSLAGFIMGIMYLAKGDMSLVLAMLGIGFIFSGLTILLSLVIKKVIRLTVKLTSAMTMGIKSLFIGGSN